MLTTFTATSVLPRISGTAEGMGLVLARATLAARAAGAPASATDLRSALARNCIAVPPTAGDRPADAQTLINILV